ncbi:hypothetical protein DFH05DRAFT_202223 [Lentinula detonsa]|nr:hypothetical protein DFH05DRAFT_202223 [Lentinula detonsa]
MIPSVTSISEKLRFKPTPDFVNDLLYDPTEGTLDSESLDQPATKPSVSHLFVKSSKLPFTICICEVKEGMGITVCVVLRQLYVVLQEQLTTQELESIRPEARENILKAFERRCDNLAEHSVARAVQQKEAGPRKIDYLEGFSKFAGFEVVPSDYGDLTLRLHVR